MGFNVLQKLNDLLNFNKGDPLGLIRFTMIKLSEIMILKKLLVLALAYNFVLFAIEIVYFCYNFNLQLFIQFFSLNVGALHGYAASCVCLIYETEGLDLVKYMDSNFIKLNRVKVSTYERIMKRVLLRRYIYLIHFVSMQLLCLFLWPIFGYEDDYYFPIFFLQEYVKPVFGTYICNALRYFFYLTTLSYAICAGLQVQFAVYYLSHMEFQLIIVEEALKELKFSTSKYGVNQFKIKSGLKICTDHYLSVKGSMDQFKSWIFWPMVTTCVGSFILLLSYVYFVIAQASLEAFPRVLSLGSICACSVALYAICGQGLIDQCDNVNSCLYGLPWYRYDKKNCELLRLFMVTSSRSLHLSILGFIDVDTVMVMKVYKFIFSSLATIQQIVALRKKEV